MIGVRRSLYVETTIPSYLAARPSRDLIVAAHQQVTHEWWRTAREDFELFVSEAVLAEVRCGDPEVAARRLGLLQDLPVLEVNSAVRRLAEQYERELGLGRGARRDLLHIACAVAHEMEYLATWNCSHLANAVVVRRLMEANARHNRSTPLIVTPDVLLGTETGELA